MCSCVSVCVIFEVLGYTDQFFLSSGFGEGKQQEQPWPESERNLAVLLSSSLPHLWV